MFKSKLVTVQSIVESLSNLDVLTCHFRERLCEEIFFSSHMNTAHVHAYLHICTPSHLRILTHLHIFTSGYLHIFTSSLSHLHIITSANLHICTGDGRGPLNPEMLLSKLCFCSGSRAKSSLFDSGAPVRVPCSFW